MPIDRLLPESDGPFAQIDGRAAWLGGIVSVTRIGRYLAAKWF
jgi:hypothetical protein